MPAAIVATLKRKAAELPAELKAQKKPILIKQLELPCAPSMDVDRFELFARKMLLVEGRPRGERAIEEGRTVPSTQAKQRMAC